ncbi:16S rRNA (guanine(966)-N(2))-methyltransferase RsmD [Phaeobacter gallaeciensis]|uniref:Ribosomal RNA small subunit methyltransferase D n=1 Tax=Phaeobacter gallaeciensis TaxID=60890 RepID=A0AAD0EBS4_9RHOB|nr:16S rRNA (guanine(966)-N(2))-methyltransferase RsmD [Phaeobacter gallaeciensis]AHD08296.1 RNA methyltransferase, RsmD family [Phaeobacter gallaeciensis DSM 26640]ATE91562.1 ribosomal RNA small subunit methyltransferase D [Phaeobacter gallaeciensis]ATE95838.1 ribosomal RNA small subunit methyltransferase D [Phaeobacter gallaeciensis]ATF00178.1 ribosomal RNA small subunit methyltransferase D [Phaeobacter gallaeciensis]ATF04610.1 ribosomal RNA small subunit methyltransferase D [Phaeobacter gal
MRIIAGDFRGRALTSVGKGDAGAHLRPTTDRVRESLFNVLSHLVDFDGLRVLDLFAGTGALGLEALSRGAADAVFVDDGRVSQGLISKNIELLRIKDRARLIRRDTTRLPTNEGAPCDVVFLDPPYGKSLGEQALTAATRGGWLAEDALIVWEESSPMQPPEGFTLHDSRKYGDTHVTLLWRES